jgi:SNF2 family DNA or RNA helicase
MQFGEPENLNELHERIKAFVIRRTKTEVMKELPPKIRTTIVLEFDEAERAEYNEYIYEASRTQDHHLAIIEKAKQAAALGKLPAAINWIEEFLESGEKLVVFANHREITKRIYEKFQDQAVMIIGGISQAERQSAVDRFQDDPNVNLFVGNMEAAGVGITLTAASNVAIIEFPWTPDTVEQAIDRCHRIGQTDSVTAWFLVAENTIEESIVDMLQSKAGDIHKIMDNTNTEQDFHILNNLLQIIRTQTENIREINIT